MRLLQLVARPDELLDLHPNISVVQSLDDTWRRALVDTVAGLPRARAAARAGLIEAHEVLMALDEDSLSLLDLRADDLDPVVRAAHLPTVEVRPEASALRAAEGERDALAAAVEQARAADAIASTALAEAQEAADWARRRRDDAVADAGHRIDNVDDLARRLDQLVEQHRRLDDELVAARQQAGAARSRWNAVEAATKEVRVAREAAARRRAEAAAALDRAARALDAEASGGVDAARAALAGVEAEVEAERAARAAEQAAAGVETAPIAARLEEIDERVRALQDALVPLAPVDTASVESALAEVRAAATAALVPSRVASATADDLVAVEAELTVMGEAPPREGRGGRDLAAARARLDDARQGLLEAEQAVRNPELDRADVDALEDAHVVLLDALDKAEGRFGGARAQRRLSEARSAEDALLERMGFSSYSEYMMGSSLLHVDPEKEEALDAARRALADAEDDWRDRQRDAEATLARAALVDRRRALLEQGRELLGGRAGSSMVDELRAMLVPSDAVVERRADLQAALEVAGLAVGGEDLDADELEALAEAWLAESGDLQRRRDEVLDELGRLDADREATQAELSALTGEVPDGGDPEAGWAGRVAAASEELATWVRRQEAHEAAQREVGALEVELAAATEADEACAVAAADAEAEVVAAEAAATPLEADVRRLEDELAATERLERDADARLSAWSEAELGDGGRDDADLATADAALAAARDAAAVAASALAEHTDRRAAVEATVARLRAELPADAGDLPVGAEEIEWYLLARLAAQRSVSLAGSVPILLDDALRGIGAAEVRGVLDRLEPMADAVQVIVVSDDPVVAGWAVAAGPARAAVVRPTRV